MEKKKLLSISLLVSNRPDTVEKCLKSLEHLRKSVPSELILVDTGCGEKVREIIELYADKIVEFTWCGDFSKARNAGLKEATGEWFLYLDDDEWFEDTSEIEEFFLHGDWKKYGYALYIQRNYSDLSGNNYTDAVVSRMIKLSENVKFVYSIHECFNNSSGRIKKFHSYVHHYGYIYKSEKEFFLHSQRNIVPLLKEHKENPHQLRHNVQLAQEYNGTYEYRKSIEISLEGIKQSEGNPRYVNALFVNVVNCYYNLYDYKTALEYGMTYLNDTRINELAEAAIYSTLCKTNYELGNYQECLKNYEKYYKAFEKQLKEEDYFLCYNCIFLYCFEKKEINSDIGFGIRAALFLDDTKKAYEIFQKIDYTEKTVFVDRDAIEKIVDKYIVEKEEEYFRMVKTMLENTSLITVITDMIEKKRKKKPDIFVGTSIKWKRLESYHWYFKYLTFWSSEDLKKVEDYQTIWNQPEYALPKSMEYEIWTMGSECDFDIADIIRNIPFYKWEKAVEFVCQMVEWTELQEINDNIQRLDPKLKHNAWWKICYQKRFFREMDGMKQVMAADIENIRCLWKEYVRESIDLFNQIYRGNLFEEKSSILPECCQISFLLQDFFEMEEKKAYLKQVNVLKEIKECSSDFSVPVKYYLTYIQEQMKIQEAEQKIAQNELQWMAQRILPKIEELIQLHKESEALAVVRQIRQLLPDDLEMIELENRLKVSLK